MKRKINKSACFALFVVLALLASLFPAPAYAAGDEGIVTDTEPGTDPTAAEQAEALVYLKIHNSEEFQDFVRSCRNSSYSRNLVVDLMEDLDLRGTGTMPVPSFSGTFYGNGHSIKNFSCAANGSHQALFRYLEEGGMIVSLNVTGEVTPYGSRGSVGGIVGTNRGTVTGCSFSGTVDGLISVGGIVGENLGVVSGCTADGIVGGQHFTGGIVGYNEGVISRCSNYAQVNIEVRNETVDFGSIDIRDILGLGLVSAADGDAVSDSGGIVGISIGTVLNCENHGPVGYQHYGYNIGGIAGRQSGYMAECVNYGDVLGRQDVGGVVGQMEPFLILDDSARLVDEIAALQDAMNGAMNNMDSNSAALGSSAQTVEDNGYNLGRDIYTENAPETDEEKAAEREERRENFREGAQNVGDRGEQAVDDLGDDTISHITEGNLTDEDYAVIGDVGGGLISDGGSALGNRIDERRAEREAEAEAQAAQNAQMRAEYTSLAGGLNSMGGTLHRTLSSLSFDMKNVSRHYNNILTMFTNALSGNLQLTVLEDISDLDTDEDMGGKVRACENHGAVNGDSNTGGIAGSMAVEAEFDMDGILSSTITDSVSISTDTYFARCIIRKCVNDGPVTAKKDFTGGVCGLSELGVISTSENYGDVSASGNYSGGVVGQSKSIVTESYAMCAVEGSEYVGGISGQGRRLVECSSIVEVDATKACSGAISGWVDKDDENVRIEGNTFVSDSLGGIDGISYAGQADAISFEELVRTEGLPERFRTLKLVFRANGVTVKEISFPYGGSVDESEIPAVPELSGSSGFWPEVELTNLTSSAIVDAIYLDRLTGVAADTRREGSPLSVVVVEGLFEPDTTVSTQDWSEGLDVSRDYRLDEAVQLHISSHVADSETYSVHYLAPKTGRLDARPLLYVLRDGALEKQDYTVDGSYLVFDGTGTDLRFCLFTPRYNLPLILGCGLGLAAAAALGWVLLRRHSRKKSRTAAPAAAT